MPPRVDVDVREGLPASERGLSDVAAAYRRAEPYTAACSTLMASVAGFAALGYGLDRWLGHTDQWMLATGSVIGIAVGFVGFFTRVLRADAAAKRQRAGAEPRSVRGGGLARAGQDLAKRVDRDGEHDRVADGLDEADRDLDRSGVEHGARRAKLVRDVLPQLHLK